MCSVNKIQKIIKSFNDAKNINPMCGSMYCTTCGGYGHNIVSNISSENYEIISSALASITLKELFEFGQWLDVLERINKNAVISVYSREGFNLDQSDVREVDWFLLVARRFSKDNDHGFSNMYESILSSAINLAISELDVSLVETLVLVLKDKVRNYPELLEVALNVRKNDKQMQRVLYNCLRELLPEVREYAGEGNTVYSY